MILIFLIAATFSVYYMLYEKGLNFLLSMSVAVFNIMCALYFQDLAIFEERSVFLGLLTLLSLCYLVIFTGADHSGKYSAITYTVICLHSLGSWYILIRLLWF